MVFRPMEGVSVVEVAQFTFTPSAGAVLADWGADVIKVEHAVHGDAQRGITIGAGGAAAGSFQPLMEHPNRGKRSIGLALEVPSGHEVLLELVRNADVFITNFLPNARQRLHIEVEDLRAVNPKPTSPATTAPPSGRAWAAPGALPHRTARASSPSRQGPTATPWAARPWPGGLLPPSSPGIAPANRR